MPESNDLPRDSIDLLPASERRYRRESEFSLWPLPDGQPDDYITFFSLRGWGKFKDGTLTTEQVYIHGKTMIVDDRLVLCGSANINERSQRGDRDSELVAVIRDTDMVDGSVDAGPSSAR